MTVEPARVSLISAKGLTKRFKTGRTHIEVLKSVDFDACAGDVTMVMGPSGSGKSTLIAALSGLMKPDAGQVTALGEDLWSRKPGKIDRFRLQHCGFIFQGFNLFPALSASRAVDENMTSRNLSPVGSLPPFFAPPSTFTPSLRSLMPACCCSVCGDTSIETSHSARSPILITANV